MKKLILFFFLILIILVAYSTWRVLGASVKEPEGKYLVISSGTSINELENQMLSGHIIQSRFWFSTLARTMHFKKVKPGRYLIEDGISLLKLVKKLRGGEQAPLNLVITKLRLREELARKCGAVFEFDSLQMIQFISDNDSLKQFNLDTGIFMAAVLPNTYSYFWNSSVKMVVQKLVNEWEKFWTEERSNKCSKTGLSRVEVSILASIIDEESNYEPEKPLIASVYLNRLKKGIPLQADPTVKFAMRDFSLKRIYQKHLEVNSPYNTYLNSGLPPGPICTPQLNTLDAVLDAPETNYLYFVAKNDFSGQHEFSATYEEHTRKANNYRKALNQQEAIRKSKKENASSN